MFILDTVSKTCTDPGMAAIVTIFKRGVNILWIVGPLLSMIGLVFSFIKLMTNPDEKKYKNLIRNSVIGLVVLFLLPMIVNTIMGLFDDTFEISACWNMAEKVNNTTGKDSHYINNNKKKPTNIYVDPKEYQTGEKPRKMGNTGSHVNSINKIKYNIYYQNDSKWGSYSFASGSSIADSGCMITAVASISSSYDNSISPYSVFKKYPHNYPRDGIMGMTNNYFNCSNGSTKKANIVDSLRKGNPVVIKVYGNKKNGNSHFTSSQHYMALIDINSDSIFVGNGYSSSTYGQANWFKIDDVLTSVITADYCTPTDKLLSVYN